MFRTIAALVSIDRNRTDGEKHRFTGDDVLGVGTTKKRRISHCANDRDGLRRDGEDIDEISRDAGVALALPGAFILVFYNHGCHDIMEDEKEMVSNHGPWGLILAAK